MMNIDFRVAVLAFRPGPHGPTKFVNDVVQAVANPKDRKSKRKHSLVSWRSVGVIDGRRASAEDDACRPVALDFIQRGIAGQDSGKDFQFADAEIGRASCRESV